MSAANDPVFLTEEQVDELTGIKRGATIGGVKCKKFALQVEFLRSRGIAFIENARGKPIIARAAVEGRGNIEPPRKGWQPKVVGA